MAFSPSFVLVIFFEEGLKTLLLIGGRFGEQLGLSIQNLLAGLDIS